MRRLQFLPELIMPGESEWDALNATAAISTSKMPTVDEMLGACKEFSRQFPPWTLTIRIELHPVAYHAIKQQMERWHPPAQRPFSAGMAESLLGIRLCMRLDLPMACHVTWYASGHFEIPSAWCDQSDDTSATHPVLSSLYGFYYGPRFSC